jgi:putative zinc finger/helix-turn-helix YgiT family protein
MSRPYPWKCRSCGNKTLNPTVVDYSTQMEHDGRSYSLLVPDLEILECETCHERVLPDASFQRLIEQLRVEAGLLAPAEIREKRKQLGLTQEQLASYLKVAEETISRWETGRQIQQRHSDLILRAFFDLPELRTYLGMMCETLLAS